MRAIIFYTDIKKDGVVLFKKGKHYFYKKQDHDFFYLKTELGDIDTICKLNLNVLYMISEDNYDDD